MILKTIGAKNNVRFDIIKNLDQLFFVKRPKLAFEGGIQFAKIYLNFYYC